MAIELSLVEPTASACTLNMLAHALKYADKGWRVFPLHNISSNGQCSCGRQCGSEGKHPRIGKWNKAASTSAKSITEWWSKWPNANIGILTGRTTNLIVLDIDPRNRGDDSLNLLLKENPNLEKMLLTRSVSTGGNGTHYYFQWRNEQKKKAGVFGGGIDIQSDGAYVVAPPSNHKSGQKYKWNNNHEIAPYPDVLLVAGSKEDARWQGVIPEGKRNTTLASIAGKLFSSGKQLGQVKVQLHEENINRCSPPLEGEEVDKIASSIFKQSKANKSSFKTQWQKEVVASEQLNAGQVRTLMALSHFMDVDGRSAFPTQDQLARFTNVTRQTINSHISAVTELGWIKRYEHRTGNRNIWNHGYTANIPTM